MAVGLKLAWRNCPPAEPRVFLSPLVGILRLFLGSSFARRPDGYWNPAWHVLITKDCAGMNYFLIVFCLLVFTHLRSFRSRIKIGVYGAFFIGAYFLTLLANASRVVAAVILGRTGLIPQVLAGQPHLALGAFVYFFFLAAGNWSAGILIRGRTRGMEESR